MSAYSEGAAVQYYSDSHACWIDTKVLSTKPSGEVQLGCKPGVWIKLEEQKTKVRAFSKAPPAQSNFKPGARNSSGPWCAEQALSLGGRTVNQLGARKPEELSWANVIDGITSVHAAVEQLNSGTLPCAANYCVVYSASSQTHYLLYKAGDASECLLTPGALRPQGEADELKDTGIAAAEVAVLQADLYHEKERSSQLERELEEVKTELAKAKDEEAKAAAAEEKAIQGLQSNLEGERDQRTKLESQVDDLARVKEALEKQLTEAKELAEEEIRSLKDAAKETSEATSEASELREKMQAAQEAASQTEKAMADKVANLENSLAASQGETARLLNENSELVAAIKVHETQASASGLHETQLQAAEDKIAALTAAKEAAENATEEKVAAAVVAAKDAAEATAADKIATAVAAQGGAETKAKELSEEVAQLKEKIGPLEEAQTKVKSAEEEIEILKEMLVKEQKGSSEDLEAKYESEKEKRKQAESALEKSLESNDTLGAARRALEKQLQEEKAHREAAEAENASLKKQLDDK